MSCTIMYLKVEEKEKREEQKLSAGQASNPPLNLKCDKLTNRKTKYVATRGCRQ